MGEAEGIGGTGQWNENQFTGQFETSIGGFTEGK